MKILGRVIGARVHHFKDVRLKSAIGPSINLERPGRNVIGFGLQHLNAKAYIDIARGQTQVAGTYVPVWLEALAKSSATIGKTLILLEIPPFEPAFLELDAIDDTIPEQMDAVLNHSLRRLRPLFKAGSVARQNGWVLDGCDLRYRYQHDGTQFLSGDAGLRHSIHKDLDNYALGEWEPSQGIVKAYYGYLTGLSNDVGAFDTFVSQLVIAVGNRDGSRRRSVFAQGAAHCRTLWKDLPEQVKRAAIDFFAAIVPKVAQQVRADNVELSMNESVAKEVVKYGVAEQLMNLLLLGYLLSDGGEFHNVVIVAGDDHLKLLAEFLGAMEHKSFVASTCWSATPEKSTPSLGFFCELPVPIDIT